MPDQTDFPSPWTYDPRLRRTGDVYYLAREILVARSDLPLVIDALRDLGAGRPDLTGQPIDAYVVRFVLPLNSDGTEPDVPAVVDLLRALPGNPRVGPNHAFAANNFEGLPKLHGGGATDPRPAPPLPKAEPVQPDSRVVRVAVIDTGLPAEALTLPLFRDHQRHGKHEPDPVYANTAIRRIGLMGGHGAATAGIIARYAGRAHLSSVQVLDVAGVADEMTFAAGVLRARDGAAEIISMSLGGTYYGEIPPVALSLVLDDLPAGTVLVAAAGNTETAMPKFYPASRPGVISVAALNSTGAQLAPAAFSNTGPWITACAPGVRVHCAYVHGTWEFGNLPVEYKGYVSWSGTSFATPYVAARIAAATTIHDATAADAAAKLLPGLPVPFPGYGSLFEAPAGFTF
jgi:subtilisin family serine protease